MAVNQPVDIYDESNPDDMISQEAVALRNPFDGPIPGQSLTENPEAQPPYLGTPEHTDIQQATQQIFLSLLNPKLLKSVVTMMSEGTPVLDVAKMLLVTGLSQGKYNIDLMIMLIEPTMYMLLAIAEKVGIRDIKLYRGEEDEEDEFMDEEDSAMLEDQIRRGTEAMKNPKRFSDVKIKNTTGNPVDQEIIEKLEQLDVSELKESLLSRPPANKESLMGRG